MMTVAATLVPTNYIWAASVLVNMGVPATTNNISNMLAWMSAEEPVSNWYHANNPLNINASGAGFDTFPSLSASSAATAKLIKGSYPGIYNALASNAPAATFSAAVVTSPWAASHYGVAAAGAPSQYIVAGRGLDYIATLNGKPGIVTATGGQTIQAGTTDSTASGAGTTSNIGCSSKQGGLDIFGAKIGDPCQLKALTGGLLVGVGGAVLLVGAVLIASYGLKNTGVGRAVGSVAKSGPVGFAAGFVTERVAQASPTARRDAALEAQIPAESYKSRQARYQSEGFETMEGSSAPPPGKVREMRQAA
jgi:hypothetical protein